MKRCFLDKKEYLVEKKFDAVKRLIVYEKMFDGFADLGGCSDIKPLEALYYLIRMVKEEDYDKLSYKIAYNKHYGYPVTVFDERLNHIDKIVLGVRSPFYGWHIEDLIMLPKGTEYTDEVLRDILDYFSKQGRLRKKDTTKRVEVIDIVGGNLIKSGIFDVNETFKLH